MTSHDPRWDLAGRLVVGGRGLDHAQRRAVAAALDPFEESAGGGPADVSLARLPDVDVERLVELHGPARDGRTTAVGSDGSLLVRCGERWASVPAVSPAPAEVGLEAGLDPADCWVDVIRPVLHLGLHRRRCVAVHAAAVERDGSGVLVAGWSESGKTEVALAMVERGAHFLSDKWTVAGTDGDLSAFPVQVGVRGWVLAALPRLRASLPLTARTRLTAARALDVSTRRVREGSGGGRAAASLRHGLDRAVVLGDRAGLAPSTLRRAYGDRTDPTRRVPLGTVVVLVNAGSSVVVEDVDARWAAVRLARSAAYERRAFFDLQERGAYALLDGRAGARDACVSREEELLEQAFRSAERVLRVTCPYPGDPGRVVDAVLAHR